MEASCESFFNVVRLHGQIDMIAILSQHDCIVKVCGIILNNTIGERQELNLDILPH